MFPWFFLKGEEVRRPNKTRRYRYIEKVLKGEKHICIMYNHMFMILLLLTREGLGEGYFFFVRNGLQCIV